MLWFDLHSMHETQNEYKDRSTVRRRCVRKYQQHKVRIALRSKITSYIKRLLYSYASEASTKRRVLAGYYDLGEEATANSARRQCSVLGA